MTKAPIDNITKLASLMARPKKLEHSSLASPFSLAKYFQVRPEPTKVEHLLLVKALAVFTNIN
jgi:hypothetical protein